MTATEPAATNQPKPSTSNVQAEMVKAEPVERKTNRNF